MNHCYIFDYTNCKIYHTKLPEFEIEDVDRYIAKKLNIKISNCYTLCSEEELEIEELD